MRKTQTLSVKKRAAVTAAAREYTPAEQALRWADRILDWIVDFAFLLVLLIGIYFMYDSAYVFYHSRAGGVSGYRPEGDVASLQQEVKDAVAWVIIDDTSVDYPIMQGVDNREYLNKDPYGKFSLAGSIFLDSRNAGDFSDDYSIVYGHHMSGSFMFGALDAFADEEYFEAHRTGTLLTERGEIPFQCVGFFQTDASDSMVFDPDEDHSGMAEYIKTNSEIYREPAFSGDHTTTGESGKARIVALTTCKSPTTTKRTVLFIMLDE